MANNFPAVPTDLELRSVLYTLDFGTGSSPALGPSLIFDGVSTTIMGAISGLGGSGSIQFEFTSPGSFGSFDQEAAETAMAKITTDIFQLMTDLTGVPIPILMQNFCVNRTWTWADAAGNTATYTDAMPLS